MSKPAPKPGCAARRVPRMNRAIAQARKDKVSAQAQSPCEPGKMAFPTATGEEYFTFQGSNGVVRENLECEQIVPTKKKKHRHLSIRSNPSGEKISYGQLAIGALLGKGAQGDVRLAKFKGRPYALKRLCTMGCGAVGGSQAVQRELEKVILELTHLHRYAVESYDAYWSETDAKLCILMEFMQYGSLVDVLRKLHSPPQPSQLYPTVAGDALPVFCISDVSLICRSILKGLVELQRLGLVHNDIKPANILVGETGAVKIGDFGVARWTNSVSFAGSGTGTQCYMSPEKLLGKNYSYQSDVYSFGLTAAMCATGKFPISIKGLAPYELLTTIAQGIALDPCAPLQPELHDLIGQSLTVEQELRPQAKQLLAHPLFLCFPPARPPHFLAAIAEGS